MTKIRCGSVLCMHNYGEFCDAEEVNITDVQCQTNLGKRHLHCCKDYEIDNETMVLTDMVLKEIFDEKTE